MKKQSFDKQKSLTKLVMFTTDNKCIVRYSFLQKDKKGIEHGIYQLKKEATKFKNIKVARIYQNKNGISGKELERIK